MRITTTTATTTTATCHDHDTAAHGDGHGDGNGGGQGEGGAAATGTTIGWKNPNRPGRHCGTSTGQVPGGQLDPCDFDTPPWNEWPGDRGDLYLPFLFMRANAGDLGARPVVGPFWESPDILLLAGVDPAVAPPVPPELGQTALAGKPNTLYAHVWNFGIAAAPNVVVEFYWCDPTLGIGPAGAHLIGVRRRLARRPGQRPRARGRQVSDGLGPDVRQRRPRMPRRPGLGRDVRRPRHPALGRRAQPARRRSATSMSWRPARPSRARPPLASKSRCCPGR